MRLLDQEHQLMTPRGFKGAQLSADFNGNLLDGRAFRFFHEFSADTWIRVVLTKPILATEQVIYCDAGSARLTTQTGGTPSGTWTEMTNVYPRNTLVAYTLQAAFATGGTVSGGIVRDVVRVNAGGGAGAVNRITQPRILAAGTYYIFIDVTAGSGVYNLYFEELEEGDFD